jgi:hypothetical protein
MAKSPEYYETRNQYLSHILKNIDEANQFKITDDAQNLKVNVVANERRNERKEIFSKYGKTARQEHEKAKDIRKEINVKREEQIKQEILADCKTDKERIQALKDILRAKRQTQSNIRKQGSSFFY